MHHEVDPIPEPRARSLIVEGLRKSFGRHMVLDALSLRIEPGEIVGLLGRDGAGKTVCFNLIMGLMKADSGRILLGGADVTASPADRRARLGLTCLPQEASIFRGMTVEQNIEAVLELREPDAGARAARLDEILAAFQLDHLRRLPAIHLSGGERRRCEIARATAADPAFLLLDEPFAGIDPLAILDIKRAIRMLKARNVGLLVSDHDLRDMLELIERAYVIHEGRLVFAGPPERMLADPEVRRLYLGPEAEHLRGAVQRGEQPIAVAPLADASVWAPGEPSGPDPRPGRLPIRERSG